MSHFYWLPPSKKKPCHLKSKSNMSSRIHQACLSPTGRKCRTRMANSALKCRIIILINFGQLYSNSCYTTFNIATLGMWIACEFHQLWIVRLCIYHKFRHLTKRLIFCRTGHARTVTIRLLEANTWDDHRSKVVRLIKNDNSGQNSETQKAHTLKQKATSSSSSSPSSSHEN